jgi:hypothetical protein
VGKHSDPAIRVTPCGPGLRRTLAALPRFIEVLAPNAKLRSLVVPQEPPAQAQAATEAAVAADCEVETAQARPRRISWARLLKRVLATA